MERSIGLCRVLKQKVFFYNQNKRAKRVIALGTLMGLGGVLGVVGEFQNTPYPLMSFKNPIF